TGKSKYIPLKGEKEEEIICPLYPTERYEDLDNKSDDYKKKPGLRQKARGSIGIDLDDDSDKTNIPKWSRVTPAECGVPSQGATKIDECAPGVSYCISEDY
ncbi:BgTH12-02028, partial [Blumeria graminis f. sp. triticale]